MRNQKKLFPSLHFDLFHDAIDVPDGYISRRIFYEVHEREENFQALLRKAPKIRYKVTHPGNNKQGAPLTLAIFQESITAVIKKFFPNRLEAANVLILLQFQATFQYIKPTWQCRNSRRSNARIPSSCGSQTGLKHGQNVHHFPLPNKPLMLL